MNDQDLLFDEPLESHPPDRDGSADALKAPRRKPAKKTSKTPKDPTVTAANATPDSPPPLPDDLKFEDALQQLEDIVDDMETGDLALDECLKRFELGMQLSKFCTSRLKQTERKVEVLMKNAAGDTEWQSFESDDDDDDDDDDDR